MRVSKEKKDSSAESVGNHGSWQPRRRLLLREERSAARGARTAMPPRTEG
jgi:hypothetical protein